MMSDDDDDYSHFVLTWGRGRGCSCGGGSVKAHGGALGSVSLKLFVRHEHHPEALLGSFSCQSDGIRTSIFAESVYKKDRNGNSETE